MGCRSVGTNIFVEKVLIDGVEQDLSNRYEELTDRYTKEKDLLTRIIKRVSL